MEIDAKLAHLLSSFFLDIAKAAFVATFITPSLLQATSLVEIASLLTRGLINVILFLFLSWQLAQFEERTSL